MSFESKQYKALKKEAKDYKKFIVKHLLKYADKKKEEDIETAAEFFNLYVTQFASFLNPKPVIANIDGIEIDTKRMMHSGDWKERQELVQETAEEIVKEARALNLETAFTSALKK